MNARTHPAPRPGPRPGLADPDTSAAGRRGRPRRSTDRRRPTPDAPARAAGAGARCAGASFAELPVDAIRPNAAQPRQVFDEEAMAELVHSIREVGLLQPVVVRRGRPTGRATSW